MASTTGHYWTLADIYSSQGKVCLCSHLSDGWMYFLWSTQQQANPGSNLNPQQKPAPGSALALALRLSLSQGLLQVDRLPTLPLQLPLGLMQPRLQPRHLLASQLPAPKPHAPSHNFVHLPCVCSRATMSYPWKIRCRKSPSTLMCKLGMLSGMRWLLAL